MRAIAKAAKRNQNRKSMMLISFILVVMLTVLLFLSWGLQKELDTKKAEIQVLQEEKSKEEERTKDIQEYADSTNTREFIEQTAKEKLGLLYSNEIIFKKDN